MVNITEIVTNPRTFRPTGEFILVDYVPSDRAGGLHLPGNATFEWVTVKALAVGPDCKLVKAGDTCLVAAKAIMSCRVDGQTVCFTRETGTVLAVVE